MKKYFRACMMSMTMFCAIPCPYHGWDEEARPLMTLFLPLVGAWIGILWTLTAYLIDWLGLPVLVGAAILCAFPFLITGGMHMDGYLDVTDAVKSWRDPDERRRILKDPNVGSFAVIAGLLLVMAQFALFASAKEDANLFTLTLIPIVSRSMAGLCVTVLRPLTTSEYAGTYKKGVKKSHAAVFAVILVLASAAGFIFLGKYGFASLAVIAGYLLHLRRAFRSLNGMSGDVSGYALTFGELCGIAVFALI
ncbi:MAG: adenosylcobinamide-GDP ribazoletransferase [Clostridia bacterium]|nr:adenosylcobinamide-GDP ribazoletransferase [Clostridia bacterium]